MLKVGLKSDMGETTPPKPSVLALKVSAAEGGSAAESKAASAMLMGRASSSLAASLSGGMVTTATDWRSPWFHHWFSKPLSTVIMAVDREASSLTLCGSSPRRLLSGDRGTTVGMLANGGSCSSLSGSKGQADTDQGRPSPSRKLAGSVGRSFHSAGAFTVARAGREKRVAEGPPSSSPHRASGNGGGAELPRS